MITSNASVSMYNASGYNPLFVEVTRKYNCSLNELFTYEQTTAQLIANTPYQIKITGIT
jgi:hypothetical protein